MLWLSHSFGPTFTAPLLNKLFGLEYPAALPVIAAFSGPDWELVGKECNLSCKEDGVRLFLSLDHTLLKRRLAENLRRITYGTWNSSSGTSP